MNFYLERLLQFNLACILIVASATGQSVMSTALQARLEPEQSEWVLGVPVEFTVSVRNVSSVPVQTRTNLRPKWGQVSVLISEDGSTFHGFRGPEWDLGELMDSDLGTVTLKPGASVQASFSLLWNGPIDTARLAPTEGFAFPRAGTYFVKVKVSSDFGDLMSNEARVVIVQPQSDDAAIWEALKADKGLARYYAYPNGAAGQGEKLEQLLNKYPNSSHAASMKKALTVHTLHKAEIDEKRKAKGTLQQH